MDRYRRIFLDDAFSSIENVRSALAALALHPDDAAAVFEAMRLFHSLKSASAMMGYADMSALCQVQEQAFKTVHDTRGAAGEEMRQSALEAVDAIRVRLQAIDAEKPPEPGSA